MNQTKRIGPGKQKPENTDPPQRKGIGLGDIIKGVTGLLGFMQCESCKKRQERLNRVRVPLKKRNKISPKKPEIKI